MTKIRRRVPVDEYLKPQRRFAHLFGAKGHPEMLARIQAEADRNIRRFKLLRRRETRDLEMQKPFAITLDPGSSLANKTGSWRTERPLYVDRLPPCNAQCPAGEDIQGWLFRAESRQLRGRLAPPDARQPVPGDHGPGLLSHLRGRVQPRQDRRGGGDQLGRAIPRRRGDQARLEFRPAGERKRQAGADRRRRPFGDVGGVPPAAARPPGHGRDAGPRPAA